MKNYLLLLAAAALFGQTYRVTAQTTASSQGQALDHLFSSVIRSSVVDTPAPTDHTGKSIRMSPADLRRCCEKIDKDIQRVFFLNDHHGKMKLQVRGVYRHGGALFFCLQLNNRSYLDYDVDSIAFLITLRKPPSTPTLPKDMRPVYVFDSASMVPGRSCVTSIFVFPSFTLPPGRKFAILVGEKNGNRNLMIRAGSWTLQRARPV